MFDLSEYGGGSSEITGYLGQARHKAEILSTDTDFAGISNRYSGFTHFRYKAASRRQYKSYGTDSVAVLAAYKIVLFELRRSNAVAKVIVT